MHLVCRCCGSQVEAGTVCPVDGNLAPLKADALSPGAFLTEAAALEHEEPQPGMTDEAAYIPTEAAPPVVTSEEDAEVEEAPKAPAKKAPKGRR